MYQKSFQFGNRNEQINHKSKIAIKARNNKNRRNATRIKVGLQKKVRKCHPLAPIGFSSIETECLVDCDGLSVEMTAKGMLHRCFVHIICVSEGVSIHD